MALFTRKPAHEPIVDANLSISDDDGTVHVPTLAVASPRYAALQQRDADLAVESQALVDEADDLWQMTTKANSGALLREDQRDAYIQSLIDGAEATQSPPPTTNVRVGEITRRQNEIKLARDGIAKQLRLVRVEVSAAIVSALGSQYRETVADMCKSMTALYGAWARYAAMTDQLIENDIAWASLWSMPPGFLGENPQNTQTPLALYLKEAAAHGFIDKADIPQALTATPDAQTRRAQLRIVERFDPEAECLRNPRFSYVASQKRPPVNTDGAGALVA